MKMTVQIECKAGVEIRMNTNTEQTEEVNRNEWLDT